MASTSHFGCVVEESTKAAVADAVVRLVPKTATTAAPGPQVTTTTGTFGFTGVEDTEAWTLVVYHPEGEPSEPHQVDLTTGTVDTAPAFYPVVVTSKVVSQRLGAFVLAIVIALILGCVWFWLTQADGPRAPGATSLLIASADLGRLARAPTADIRSEAIGQKLDHLEGMLPDMKSPHDVATALAEARKAIAGMKILRSSVAERAKARAVKALDALNELKATFLPEDWTARVKAVKDNFGNDAERAKAITALMDDENIATNPAVAPHIEVLDSVHKALGGKEEPADWVSADRGDFNTLLKNVETAVHSVARAEVAERQGNEVLFDWRIGSSITVTILFWGVVGSLVRLVMVIQRYLRFRRFYVRGLYQHVALVIAVPILAAGFVKLASLATIKAGANDLQLTFSDPQIMAVGAFLLALSPWSLWDRLLGLSASVAGKNDGE